MTGLSGTTAFLQQAHRNNWQRYLSALQSSTAQGWDVCVLTAGDERQAAMYRRQLAWRSESHLLPQRTTFLVLPDPAGRRIGSGGATLAALAQVAAGYAEAQRILIIHSGGDSRRLPHCSATGKLFARIPRTLPDGRASTVFDEFLIGLSGLAADAPPGVLIASGDVLLIFDHLQLSLRRPGVTGVAAAAPAEMGTRHGVYVTADAGHMVRSYLHKPSPTDMAQWRAVDAAGQVQIDTGLVWLAGATAGQWRALATEASVAAASLNLYGDLLLPLAESTTFAAYLADASDGPATPGLQAARRVIWQELRGRAALSVERLQPAVFVHFGTSLEYWRMVAADRDLAELCGWTPVTASWPPAAGNQSTQAVSINALLESSAETPDMTGDLAPALVADSRLAHPPARQGAAIISAVQSSLPLALAADVVLCQLPAADGWVTEVFGLRDDPKQRWDNPGATYMNRPWADWLAAAGLDSEILWPGLPISDRTLWNAALFPLAAGREESLRLALPLQDPGHAAAGWRDTWLAVPRLSLAGAVRHAEGERLLDDARDVEDRVAATAFFTALDAEQPAAEARGALRATAGPVFDRRIALVGDWLASAGPIRQIRGYRGLAVATGDPAWDDRAFAVLAGMIAANSGRISGGDRVSRSADIARAGVRSDRPVVVRAAARIDFGGGWTDTPPYSFERGGTVLNAAVILDGAYPVTVEGAWLPEPRLLLESADLDITLAPAAVGEVLAYDNPADPFALLKAALVLRGIVPPSADPNTPLARVLEPLAGGLRLRTATVVPRGSGLGVSSIMAGAVLTCLDRLLALRTPAAVATMDDTPALGVPPRLFADVLLLEQMITTGGGWQDQVGGLTGGIKLVTTEPGLPQEIRLAPLALSRATEAELAARLALVYTGQQRLAKNILRSVMGRWMARDPEMTWLLGQIGQLAQAMRYALVAGDVSCFGALVGQHWDLNKRMDPGCTNPFIDELFETMGPCIAGAKLAGAGGGGFAVVITRTAEGPAGLARTLAGRFPGTPVAVWPCAIPAQGLAA
ncbi:MAG TPA: L-fucokinase [Anaerolineae bacterium]